MEVLRCAFIILYMTSGSGQSETRECLHYFSSKSVVHVHIFRLILAEVNLLISNIRSSFLNYQVFFCLSYVI